MCGINSMEESTVRSAVASKICATVQDQPAEHAVVVMAHNGSSDLGSMTSVAKTGLTKVVRPNCMLWQ